MAKMKNPGFLSREERSYLRELQMGGNPKEHVSNPGRVKARILEFQEGIHGAIERFVSDIELMHSARELSDRKQMAVPFTPQKIEDDLARAVTANRIGFLKYFFLDKPLHYLFIVCLDHITHATTNQKQAVLENMILCLELANAPKGLMKRDPRFAERVASCRATIEFLEELFKPLREEFMRNLKAKEDAHWLLEHPDEREVLVTLYFRVAGKLVDGEERAEKRTSLHRDKISDILGIPNRRATMILRFLGKRGLVEGERHRYHITEEGEDAVMFLFFSSRNINTFIGDHVKE